MAEPSPKEIERVARALAEVEEDEEICGEDLSLDEAQDRFCCNRRQETAALYRGIAKQYHDDGMIGYDTYAAALDETKGFVAPPAAKES